MYPEGVPFNTMVDLVSSPQGIFTLTMAIITLLTLSASFCALVCTVIFLPRAHMKKKYALVRKCLAMFIFGMLVSGGLLLVHFVGSVAIHYSRCSEDVPECYDSYK
jgi:hypothetical protein